MSENDQMAWHVCCLQVAGEAAEDIAEHIRVRYDVEPVQLERPGHDEVWLECYFTAATPAVQLRDDLICAFPDMVICNRRCDARDWDQFWRLHFKPHPVGRYLYCCPEWETSPALEPQRRLLKIVPGLSFGTGEHFTTRFALEMIDRLTPATGPAGSLWDVGCGSGILAVAAALLGWAPVYGTDNDATCLTQAAANAALNQVQAQVEWALDDVCAPLVGVPRSFDVVCANLFGALLIQAADRLWAATGRYLVLSGIREHEADAVADTFVALGANEVVRDGDGDWAGILLRRELKKPQI